MLMLGNANAKQWYDKQNCRFWLKDGRRRRRTTTTRVILASRAAQPHAVGSQKWGMRLSLKSLLVMKSLTLLGHS